MDESVILLLQTIAKNTEATNLPFYTAAVSAGAVILAGAIGAYGLLRQARNQSYAQIVCTERLRWLRDIREKTAKSFTLMDRQADLLRRPGTTQLQIDALSEEIMDTVHLIQVYLNNKKGAQKAVFLGLSEMQTHLSNAMASPQNNTQHLQSYAQAKQETFTALVKLGKKTWPQIKKVF